MHLFVKFAGHFNNITLNKSVVCRSKGFIGNQRGSYAELYLSWFSLDGGCGHKYIILEPSSGLFVQHHATYLASTRVLFQ